MTYTIALQDAPAEITVDAKRNAEDRFRRTLERALGGPDAVLAAHRAWQAAEDTAETEMAAEDIAMAKQWIAAATRARNDGFRDLGETEAWFEVKVDK